MNIFLSSNIAELKIKYNTFKKSQLYINRKEQLVFVPFAKKIINSILAVPISNESLSAILQITNNRSSAANVIKYIIKIFPDKLQQEELIDIYTNLNQKGFTTASKGAVTGLNNNQLNEIQQFLNKIDSINSIDEAVQIVEAFDAKGVPQVKKGVYSPWLYYLNPEFFPIYNDSHKKFINWSGQQSDSYPIAVRLFHEVAEILNEKDLGLIDAFAHTFSTESIVTGELEIQKYTNKNKNMNALNTILYGPPGTGKTYHTINKAVSIANPLFDIDSQSRENLKDEYDRLVKEGQIEFVTFHQSMGYEDFIEGIKPMEPEQGDGFLKYEVRDGVFKRLVEKAKLVPEVLSKETFSINESEFTNASFYKISLGNTSIADDDVIYNWCINNGYIALGWGDVIDFTGKTETDIQKMVPASLEKFAAQSVNYFIHYIKKNDYVIVTSGNLKFRAIGKVVGDYEFKNVADLNWHQFRKVEWLLKDVELPYEVIYNKQFSQQSLYRLDKRELKKEYLVKAADLIPVVENTPKNYVLIIDEINRGNVSQIFGELITLIEDDKRQGCTEALSVTLPYSKESFTVPPNLYIVGTMNTADRSVEALDTALRRRFVFEETSPKPNLLNTGRLLWEFFWKYVDYFWTDKEFKDVEKEVYSLFGTDEIFWNERKDIWAKIENEEKLETQISLFEKYSFSGINLQLMLETINNRLKTILSKDHTIGHAWLMNVYTLQDLGLAFKNKILPLLQEFFYNDYAKIGLILGDAFVGQKKNGKKIFANFKDDNELASEYEDKINYTLSDPTTLSIADFTAIYS